MARLEAPVSDALNSAVAEFDCVVLRPAEREDAGEVMVRDFLREGHAEHAAAAFLSTTYLLLDPSLPGRILGYVTLALSQIRLSSGESREAGGSRSTIGAVRIAMIGVDHRHAGVGHGTVLLNAAIGSTREAGRHVAARFLVADAVERQVGWYQGRGFVENRSPHEKDHAAEILTRTGVASVSVRFDVLRSTERPSS